MIEVGSNEYSDSKASKLEFSITYIDHDVA